MVSLSDQSTRRTGSVEGSSTYTGTTPDGVVGQRYYRQRVYAAELGRFLTRDPAGYEGSRWSLYAYVGGQPVDFIDPKGLKKVCGFYVWLYTGLGWCVDEEVYRAALVAAGRSVRETWSCYSSCMVDMHTCPECLIKGAAAGQINITLSHLPVIKPRDLRVSGEIWTTMNRILQVRLHDLGCKNMAARLGNLQARVNNAPVRTAPGRIVGGIIITEAAFSIVCSTVCTLHSMN
jgi:RHS repeat-associated protein